MEESFNNNQLKKKSPHSVTKLGNIRWEEPKIVCRSKHKQIFAAAEPFFGFYSQKWTSFFSYRRTISTTRPMAYNTTASMDKLTITNYNDSG